jgi:hypothetical protein
MFDSVVRIVIDVAGLAIVVFLLTSGNWLVSSTPDAVTAEKVAKANRYIFFSSLLITAIAIGLHLVWQVRKLVRRLNLPPATPKEPISRGLSA